MIKPPVGLELSLRSEIVARDVKIVGKNTYLAINDDNSAWIYSRSDKIKAFPNVQHRILKSGISN